MSFTKHIKQGVLLVLFHYVQYTMRKHCDLHHYAATCMLMRLVTDALMRC